MTGAPKRISEEEARRLWERAAELQAEASRKEEGSRTRGEEDRLLGSGRSDESSGYSLTHVRQAGIEAGIRSEFLDLALAEEVVLELEGGSEESPYDRSMQRFLSDRRRALEVQKEYHFSPRSVWMALEKVLADEPNGLELLDTRGGSPAEGGIAILESPSTQTADGSLKYLSTTVDTRRYLVRIAPLPGASEEAEGCEVLIRVPLRRSRRINGGVSLGFTGGFGLLGGVGGLALAGSLAATGIGAVPLGLLLAGGGLGGTVGVGGLTRMGMKAIYHYYLRSLERALKKILNRVERELVREAEKSRRAQLPPSS